MGGEVAYPDFWWLAVIWGWHWVWWDLHGLWTGAWIRGGTLIGSVCATLDARSTRMREDSSSANVGIYMNSALKKVHRVHAIVLVHSFRLLTSEAYIRTSDLPSHWHFFIHKWTFGKDRLVNDPGGHVRFWPGTTLAQNCTPACKEFYVLSLKASFICMQARRKQFGSGAAIGTKKTAGGLGAL